MGHRAMTSQQCDWSESMIVMEQQNHEGTQPHTCSHRKQDVDVGCIVFCVSENNVSIIFVPFLFM